ncbi:MAG: hypothetical protein ABIT71_24805, partial [Vicinamibacteraceae bacterium]
MNIDQPHAISNLEPAAAPRAFFLTCVPATTTHQRKRIARVGGHARLADSPELQATRQLLEVPSASGA